MKDVFGHSSNQTEVNPNAAPITQINPKAAALNVPQTTVNPNAVGSPGNSTQVNSNALPFVQPTQGNHELYVGQIIGGKYKVVSRINVESGEADIYACADSNDTQYCLKIYHRREQISEEVHARLQHIRAPYIANLVAWGDFNGKLYEVWPLYSRGSLAGQRFDEQSIKPYIAQMNEAIHTVHNCGLVHQDIKPANFMLDAKGELALIDFGISSVCGDGGRTHVTQIGRTNDYASPEVLFSKFCWPISDYYSLGITIYELLTGHTPYYNYDENMVQQKMDDIRDTKIPGIQSFREQTKDLLAGLLQYDKGLRWSYDAVCDWLRDDYEKWKSVRVPVPHEKQFKFDGHFYSIPSELLELVTNMAYRWTLGQNLFGIDGRFERLKETVKDIEGTEDIFAICNEPKRKGEDSAVNYFRKLYQLYPKLTLFTWRQYQYENKYRLGDAILNTLWAHDIDENAKPKSANSSPTSSVFRTGSSTDSHTFPSYDELLFWMKNNVVSQYLQFTGESSLSEKAIQCESIVSREVDKNNYSAADYACYILAYTLSKSTKLRLPSGTFSDKDSFIKFVNQKISECKNSENVLSFLTFCKTEIYDGKMVSPGFRAWVVSVGLEKSLQVLTDINYLRTFYETIQTQGKAEKSTCKGMTQQTAREAPTTKEIAKEPVNRTPDYKVISNTKENTKLICPKCGGQLRSLKQSDGKQISCPYCGENIDCTE